MLITWCFVKEMTTRTHHYTTIETPYTNCNDNIASDTFKDLATTNDEAVRVFVKFTIRFSLHAFLVARLLDGITFASYTRFVTLNIVTRKKDTVTRNNFARLKQGDITDDQFLFLNMSKSI